MHLVRLIRCLLPVMLEVLKQSFMRDLCYWNISKLWQDRTIKAVNFVLPFVLASPNALALIFVKAKLGNSSQGVLFLFLLLD